MRNEIPDDKKRLAVPSQKIRVVFTEDGILPVSVTIPPLEDLLTVEDYKDAHFSLQEHASKQWEQYERRASNELALLEEKKSRFAESPIFLNRLANLASLAGKYELEGEYLDQAVAIDPSPFFQHKIVDNLISRRHLNNAREKLLGIQTLPDAMVNLRIAAFAIQQNDFVQAEALVQRAMELDPIGFNVRLFCGGLHLIQGRTIEAIHHFRAAEEERPNSSILQTNMAVAYAIQNNVRKALACLRKAIAFNPLNANALSLFADLCVEASRDSEAVVVLQKFLCFEQKDSAIWARLARALYRLKRYDEARDALLHEGAIKESPSQLNNLGCVYDSLYKTDKALDYYKRSMEKNAGQTISYFLTARNITYVLARERQWEKLIDHTDAVVAKDQFNLTVEDSRLCDIHTGRMFALANIGKIPEAISFAQNALNDNHSDAELKAGALTTLLSIFPLFDESIKTGAEVASMSVQMLPGLDISDERRLMLINNILFAFIEAGMLDDARRLLPLVSKQAHKNPYLTATLGLLNWRLGRYDRGESLYREAIQLARTGYEKAIFTQKLNLEFGKRQLAAGDERGASRYFGKVIEIDAGSWQLILSAKAGLKSLTSKKT